MLSREKLWLDYTRAFFLKVFMAKIKTRNISPAKSKLEIVCFYQIGSTDGEEEISKSKNGQYFIRTWGSESLEPVTKLQAMKRWVSGASPNEFFRPILAALQRRTGKNA
jgi:hypothetical protein